MPIPNSPSETPLVWSHEDETRKILLLSELFVEFPTTPINIDTKSGDTKMLEKISALVKGRALEPSWLGRNR